MGVIIQYFQSYWFVNDCCGVLALNSVLNVYLVFKIKFIKYSFLFIENTSYNKKHNCIYCTNNQHSLV